MAMVWPNRSRSTSRIFRIDNLSLVRGVVDFATDL
jgi:hypothetical protein